MVCTNVVNLGVYTFTFDGRTYDQVNDETTFCYIVEGNGTDADKDLSNWVLELDCPPDTFTKDDISCTMQELPNGQVVTAECDMVNTLPNPNQVQLLGVKFDEGVGKLPSDPAVRFCVTFPGNLAEGCVDVGYKAGGPNDPKFETDNDPLIGPSCDEPANFCCTVTLPDYLSLVEASDPLISFDLNCLQCTKQGMSLTLKGCIPIQAAIPVENKDGIQSWICCSEVFCGVSLACRTTATCENLCNAITISDINAIQFDSECTGKKLVKITANVNVNCP